MEKKYLILILFIFNLAQTSLILILFPLSIEIKVPAYIPYFFGISMAGCILYTTLALNKQIKKQGELFFSKGTVFCKFFVSSIYINCFFTDALILILKLDRPRELPLLIIILIVGIPFYFFAFYRFCRLKAFYLIKDKIYISNFFEEKVFPVSAVINFKRKKLDNYLYVLKIQDRDKVQKFLIMPPFIEEFGRAYWLIKKTRIECLAKKLNGNE